MYIEKNIPALKEYDDEPTVHNFEKLCVELEELIVSVYSEISTEQERKIFYEKIRLANQIIKV